MRHKPKPTKRSKISASRRKMPRRINPKATAMKGHFKHKSLNPKLKRMKRAVPKGGKNNLHDDFNKIGESELRRPIKYIKGPKSKKKKNKKKLFSMSTSIAPQKMNAINLSKRLGLPLQ